MDNIIVTDHAIERFKERVFTSREIKDEEVIKRLQTVVKKGEVIRKEPGNANRVKFENVFIITANDKEGNSVVLTCLGDLKYVSWYTKENKNKRKFC